MVVIVEHQATWKAEFDTLSARVRAALGVHALRIDHIGSTAVPNLCAKDVIDVQITVAAFDEIVVAKMKDAGFIYRTDIVADHIPLGFAVIATDWEKRYFNAPTDERRAHIHLRVEGKPNQRYPLLFRDYLIAHRHMADAYGELKRRLASALVDENAYADVKDPAVDLIYFAAQEWATKTHRCANLAELSP